MIGTRTWKPSFHSSNFSDETFHLKSQFQKFFWLNGTVGSDLPALVYPDSQMNAGYSFKQNRYITQDEMDDIYSLSVSKEDMLLSLSDAQECERLFEGYTMWHWYTQDKKSYPCKYYGFSSYRSLDILDEEDYDNDMNSQIFGIVSGYGKIHVNTDEFYSEYMKIIALFTRDELINEPLFIFDRDQDRYLTTDLLTVNQFLNIVGKNLNVPVISWDDANTEFDYFDNGNDDLEKDYNFAMPDFADVF